MSDTDNKPTEEEIRRAYDVLFTLRADGDIPSGQERKEAIAVFHAAYFPDRP